MRAWVAACWLAVLPAIAPAAELSALEARGKVLYLSGIGYATRPVQALIGTESTAVTADAVPCVGCHGEEGRGRPEGGIVPTDITWPYLTKPYGHQHANSRRHPAFTEKSLAIAIQRGVDPAGNRLDSAMPRYELAREDMAALIAYLKRLQTDMDPGLSEGAIRVGTILPLKGPLAAVGEAMRAVLTAYFDEVNAQGGLYHRMIELKIAEIADTRAATMASVQQLLAGQPVFAVVAPFMAGSDQAMAALLEREEVPTVGPLTLFPQEGVGGARFGFYLFSGIKEQARTLLDYAAQTLALRSPRAAVIYPVNGQLLETVEALETQSKLHRWPAPARVEYEPARFDADELSRSLSETGTDVVFFLGSGDKLESLLAKAESKHWRPYVLLPGSSLQQDLSTIPPGIMSKVFLAFPSLPSDLSAEGVAAFEALRARHKLSAQHLTTQVSAYCAAQILVQGLKLSGRDVSRTKLITALEGLRDYDTGLTPRLSYGPNRHIGAPGAYVVTIDANIKGIKPVSGWMEPK